MAAAVMEYPPANMSFPLLVADEALQIPGCDPFAAAGGGLEEQPSLEVSDYLTFDEGSQLLEDLPLMFAGQYYRSPLLPKEGTEDSSMVGQTSSSNMKCTGGVHKAKRGPVERFVIRTQSEKEALDDGYKWRKYGKKPIKNNPNPRNYYRCSSEGCCVKKRVQRDPEDPSYVITTYQGRHRHPPPGAV